jgi:DNA polymerase-3 subunit epsilon
MRYSWLVAKRWYYAHKDTEEPLRSLFGSDPPHPSLGLGDVEFVALDIETTGLDAATADMLSVGWVIVRGTRVDLRTAESYIVQPSGDVGHSASVHGLTDSMVGLGHNWGVILDKIVAALTGRVLLVHHAGLDKTLLDRMSKRRYGARLHVPVVDTLAIELRRQRHRHHEESDRSLRLPALREEYGLPRYSSHDCLADALGTAELLVAIIKTSKVRTLGELLL